MDDGRKLSAWYVPSRNGAAVLVSHGSGGSRGRLPRHVRMLARHGYGVLALDNPGNGESEGHSNGLGDNAQPGLDAGLDYLERRPDVDPGGSRASACRSAARSCSRRRPTTGAWPPSSSDGAARPGRAARSPTRTLGPARTWLQLQSVRAISGMKPSRSLVGMMPRIAPRPVLLVGRRRRPRGDPVSRLYQRSGGSSVQVWEVPGAAHTGGLRKHPADYERRTVGFLDEALGIDRPDRSPLCHPGGMRILVTGSAAISARRSCASWATRGTRSPGSTCSTRRSPASVGSIADRALVRRCVQGVEAVAARRDAPQAARRLARPAGLRGHERHGTLNLLEEAVEAGVGRFVFTSTTSAFGRALTPPPGAPAAWITEDVAPVPRNIYGATKTAAEDLCELVHRDHGLPVPGPAHVALLPRGRRPRRGPRALRRRERQGQRAAVPPRRPRGRRGRAPARARARAALGFGRYIISATTPFTRDDLAELRADAPGRRAAAVPRLRGDLRAPRLADVPGPRARVRERAGAQRARVGAPLRLPPRARSPRGGEDHRSALARAVGAKGYHAESTGPYTVR